MQTTPTKKSEDEIRCWKSAIDYLSRREHSRLELRQKLQQKEFSSSVDLEALLDGLQDANYQSDSRYAESFVRSRILKGQGELKIRQLLMQRGVSRSLVDIALREAEVNWWDLAERQREKRFGSEYPTDLKARAKQIRFLLMRGFPASMAHEIISH